MKALAQAVPDQISAGVSNLNVVAYSGLRGERHWVHMEIYEGAYGGRAGKDGMDAVDILFTNTRNNPIEDVESHFPLRVHRYELREEGCAAGRWRGGIGPIRETELLDDAGFSIEGEGQRFPPWGHDGGAEGRANSITLVRADGSTQALPSKLAHMKGAAGDRVIVTLRLRRRLRRSAASPARTGDGGCCRWPRQPRGDTARLRRGCHRCACARRHRNRPRARGPRWADFARRADVVTCRDVPAGQFEGAATDLPLWPCSS